MDYLEVALELLTGMEKINGIKKYLKEEKEVPNLDVEVDWNKVEVTNFTNRLLNKVVVFASFRTINNEELRKTCCVLAEKVFPSGKEVIANLTNSRIQEKVVPDSLIRNKKYELIDENKGKSFWEQSKALGPYGITQKVNDSKHAPYSEEELSQKLSVNLGSALRNHLKVKEVIVVFGDEKKNYIKDYKIESTEKIELARECVLESDYNFLEFRHQYNEIIDQ